MEIPLNKEYTIIIARYSDNSGYQCVIEKIVSLTEKPENYSDLEIIRFEEYKISNEELKENIFNGLDYLVWNSKGPNFYQKLKYDQSLGFTSNGIDYH